MAIADINADGVPDVIQVGIGVDVFLGNPDGTLRGVVQYAPINALNDDPALGLAVADLNGDGRLDLLLTTEHGSLLILNGEPGALLTVNVAGPSVLFTGAASSFSVQVMNSGDVATAGSVSVVASLNTLNPSPAPSGDGWTCTLTGTCSRGDTLQPGQSFAPILVPTGSVGGASITATAEVSGGTAPMANGSATATILPYSLDCLIALTSLHDVFLGSDSGEVDYTTTISGFSCPVEVQSTASWLTIVSSPPVPNGAAIATPNTTGAARTASINFTSLTGWSDSIMVEQAASGCVYQLSSTYAILGPAPPNFGADFRINTATSCTWTATSNASWITIMPPSSETGMYSIVTFNVLPNSGADRSGTIDVSGQTFTVYQLANATPALAGSLPHLAVGGGWDSVVQLVNTSSSLAYASVALFDDSGAAFPIPTSIAGEDANGAGSFARVLAPYSVLTDTSTAASSVEAQTGSAQISAESGVGGFIRFRDESNGQEAIVPLETRNAASYLVAFDNTGGAAAGIAIANVSGQAATVPVTVRSDAGSILATGTLSLDASGHSSFTLTDQFAASADQSGTVEFDTPAGGRISVLGLRFPPSFHFSTIPVVASTDSGGAFAHLAAGGGWITTIELINTSTVPVEAQLEFFDDNGNPLTLPLAFPQLGTSSAASSVDQTIGANSTLIIQSSGGADVQVGSARLTTSGAVGGFVRFRYDPADEETVVPADSQSASAYTLAFDNTNGAATGVAIANLFNASATIPVILRDAGGNQIGTGTIALPANGHTSFTLTDNYVAALNQAGTVEFDAPPGGRITALGIRFPTSGAFTSIPLVTR